MDGVTELVLTTNPGLEDVVLAELSERAREAGVEIRSSQAGYRARQGVVWACLEASVESAVAVGLGLKSIHHVLRPLCQFTLDPSDPLRDMERRLAGLWVAELAGGPPLTFRITGERRGDHPFTSIDVQRAAGAGIKAGMGCGVSMKAFDVEIRVEVEGARCDVGVQRTPKALSRRSWRPYRPRTALKASVGYAMARLTLADQPPPRCILDPFCGSATMLVEAGALYPEAHLVGVELFSRPAAGARANLAYLGLGSRSTIHQADGRQLRVLLPEAGSVDVILTNPPFGMRLGSGLDFDIFYGGLLADAAHLLRDGGRLAALIWHRGAFNRALRQWGRELRTVHVRIVETGGVYPGLFILERQPRRSAGGGVEADACGEGVDGEGALGEGLGLKDAGALGIGIVGEEIALSPAPAISFQDEQGSVGHIGDNQAEGAVDGVGDIGEGVGEEGSHREQPSGVQVMVTSSP